MRLNKDNLTLIGLDVMGLHHSLVPVNSCEYPRSIGITEIGITEPRKDPNTVGVNHKSQLE